MRPDAPGSVPFPPSGTGTRSVGPPRSSPSVAPPRPYTPPATLDFALLRGALEEIPFGVATTRGGQVLYANEALARIYGVSRNGMDQTQVSDLFDPQTYRTISGMLEDTRVYDGRVRARAFDGREFDAEVHIERYSSEAQGPGGFLVVRDVSLELGALGRLVDQLGGALFRFRVADNVLEHVSPAITKLTGLEPGRCTQRPVVLTTLISADERERLSFLLRRLARGELTVADAQVSVRRPDGITRVLHLRATGRRDTSGRVRHVDGVVVDASREAELARPAPRPEPAAGAAGADVTAGATMELSYELLREASQNLNVLSREVRSMRAALQTHAASLPAAVAAELSGRLDALAASATSAAALSRGVRHAVARASLGAPLAEILESVRVTLAPLLGNASITLDLGDAGDVVIVERADELTIALTHLALRAYRFAGSGKLRVAAARGVARPPAPRLPYHEGRALPLRERECVVLEILAHAPADLASTAGDISSDMLRTIPRPDEASLAYGAAQTLIGSAGGVIESDDATFATARSVIRLHL
jgi:PAS domain S-box-containing protein